MTLYIIEHLELKLYTWCIEEYKNASKFVGKKNLLITNLKSSKKISFCKKEKKSVSELKLKNCCILDPNADKLLTPKDKFNYYIFGGILGDYPPRKRTKELTLDCERRNLGKKQMSTDTAVIVTKKVNSGIPLNKIKFVNNPEIQIEKGLSVKLPYKYLSNDGKPQMSNKILKRLKKGDRF